MYMPYLDNLKQIGKSVISLLLIGELRSDVNAISEPVELDPSECVTSHLWNFCKPYTLNSIGNWLQCREVIDGIGEGVNGTICGKWRSMPRHS
ncbi:hypothetical protein CMV_027479 [Castanea mollissima]|uniref:Uncharacterized protein n=1 Tax=Castanea mollissima TaxID=60419 RepID=A0A8J4QBM9_9ROSI|nr:hypothetical protein CMV_027479 [Castanea mollissima]